MGRDDYFVIICKILAFLYQKLKGKTKKSTEEYIKPLSKEFPIEEDYMNYVLSHLIEDGYVENVIVSKAWGGEIINIDISNMMISPKGIEYLTDNTLMKKVIQKIPELADIVGIFI